MTDDPRKSALARRSELQAEIERIDLFLDLLDEFGGDGDQQPVAQSQTNRPSEDVIRDTIISAGRPMKRGELAAALAARGVAVNVGYLGTMMWRMRDRFENTGSGYWPSGVPKAKP